MIDFMEEMDHFKPVNIDELEQKRGNIPDDVKQSVGLYNKALQDMQNRNEDMAIIALKKAVSINPGFYEAINLTGLCYLKLEDKENAKAMFNKVIQAESNSIKALEYLTSIKDDHSNDKSKRVSKDKEIRFTEWFKIGLDKEKDKPYYLKYVAGFMIGVICTGMLWYLTPSSKALINMSNVDLEKEIKSQTEQINTITSELEESEQSLVSLEKQNNDLLNEFEQYKKHNDQLMEVQILKEKGSFQEAADILIMLQTVQFGDNLQKRYTNLWDEVIPTAAKEMHNEAVNIYFSKSSINDVATCSKALNKFKRVLQLGDDWDFMPNFYYVAGKCAFRADEPELAKKWFQRIIDFYPNHNNVDYAKNRIEEINEGRPIVGS